jgi:hypothetical protein
MLHVYRLVLFALMWNGARRHFLACSAAFYENASICSFAHSLCIIIIIILFFIHFGVARVGQSLSVDTSLFV